MRGGGYWYRHSNAQCCLQHETIRENQMQIDLLKLNISQLNSFRFPYITSNREFVKNVSMYIINYSLLI